jgi:hypothetical protein
MYVYGCVNERVCSVYIHCSIIYIYTSRVVVELWMMEDEMMDRSLCFVDRAQSCARGGASRNWKLEVRNVSSAQTRFR